MNILDLLQIKRVQQPDVWGPLLTVLRSQMGALKAVGRIDHAPGVPRVDVTPSVTSMQWPLAVSYPI